jgi:hypothetical protein
MDEATASYCEPDMTKPIEEHEVSRLEPRERNTKSDAELRRGVVGERHAELAIRVGNKPGAVEPRRGHTSEAVRDPQVTPGDANDLASSDEALPRRGAVEHEWRRARNGPWDAVSGDPDGRSASHSHRRTDGQRDHTRDKEQAYAEGRFHREARTGDRREVEARLAVVG